MRPVTLAACLVIALLSPPAASSQPPAPSHSVVWFPAQRTLFGGCTVRDGFLGNIAEADLAKWPAAMRDLERFDAEIVVPGHGNPGTRDLIKGTAALAEKALTP